MDGENHGNGHRQFEGDSGDRLSVESLPSIDSRLLSQSELRALSSSLSPSTSSSASLAAFAGVEDDKIDRSVFNESAGSRKQTFLRLRLARNPPPPAPPSTRRKRGDSSVKEKSEIASLLGSLFSIDSIQIEDGGEDEGEEEEELEDDEGQTLIPVPIHDYYNVYQNPCFASLKKAFVQGISKKESRRRRPGRTRKTRNPNNGISIDSNSGKKRRGRPRKSVDRFDHLAVSCRIEDQEEILNLENREGTMVDLTALANCVDDLYGDELKRITEGLDYTKEGLLGFLEKLNGEWVNRGKKKKVVEACDYGGYLPRGWKLMLCVKKKDTDLWLSCRRYISPDGKEFATCKEVSTYLQSLLESQSKNQLCSLQSENKTTLENHAMTANESLVSKSYSMHLPPVLGTGTYQNLGYKRTNSEVFEEAKGAENGDDITETVITSVISDDEGNLAADFMNGDKETMKERDDNMENLEALWYSEAQFGDIYHEYDTLPFIDYYL
ncbi:unnamed protein product [Cochlearia groenlandica]